MKKVYKLVSKKVQTKSGTEFTDYELLSSAGHWFRITCDKKLRELLPDFVNHIVEVNVERSYNRKVNTDPERDPLLIPTRVITSIQDATDEDTRKYNEIVDKRLEEMLADD